MYKVDTQEQDKKRLQDLMSKDHEPVNLEQFGFAKLALLDIIDNDCKEHDKERLAAAAIKLTDKELEPLQQKLDKAIYELRFINDEFTGTEKQQAIVDAHKNNLDLTKLVARKADNKLLTDYLILEKGMPVSQELKNNLYANGHDELLTTIDKKQVKLQLDQNWNAQVNQDYKQTKKQTLRM